MVTKIDTCPSMKGEGGKTQPHKKEFLDLLRKHLAIFGEHYRQRISELSLIAYAEDLSGLTPQELDAACRHARRTSEFMPVSAAILKAHEEIRESHREGYLGVPLLEYSPVTQEERDEALKFSEELKKKLGAPEAKPEKKPIPVRPSLLSLEEQIRILKSKGFL